MANDLAIEVEGLRELRTVLRRLGEKDLQEALKRANKSAAEQVVRAALPDVPVRSGRLRAAVRATGSQSAGRALAGGAKAPQALVVHWGAGPRTGLRGPHNVRRNPFLLNAAQRQAGEVAEEYETEIERLMDTVRSR